LKIKVIHIYTFCIVIHSVKIIFVKYTKLKEENKYIAQIKINFVLLKNIG